MTDEAKDSTQTQPWWLWAASAGLACICVAAFSLSGGKGREPQACAHSTDFMEQTWSAATSKRLRDVGAGEATLGRLDTLANGWKRERAEVCHGAQAGAGRPTRWSARRRCLERWAERFDAAVEIGAGPVVSVDAVVNVLRPASDCRVAQARAPLPAEPGRLARVLAGRRHLSRAEVWIALGSWTAARSELSTVRASLGPSAYEPLLLEADLWERLLPVISMDALVELAARATRAGEERTAARALARAILSQAQTGRPRDPSLELWCRALVERTDDDVARGWWMLAQGEDVAAAREHLKRGLGSAHALASGSGSSR